ncbi:MAG: gamma carbonic anhydrase family protein [Planctomycetota bacterium]|nr:gamma carbonic anhydrase family protein [Planctomycetota bacterium]MDA1179562.1 gamma carbonic anhydrase family protein [Planctomycetota bacterium]
MTDYQIAFRPQQISPTAFLAPNATVLGDVTIGKESSVWFGSVLRGDCERIVVGDRTNIQDGCILHADPDVPCLIGNDVTIGHGAIVHGAQISDGVLIGMRATILNRVNIGPGCLIAAGTLVTEGSTLPANSVIMGTPGRVVREVNDRDREMILHAARHYVEAAAAYGTRL